MHDDFHIPLDKDFLRSLTDGWGQLAYIYHFPEIDAIRIGDTNDIHNRMLNHRGNLPGPVRLLRVSRGGKAEADRWESMLTDFYKQASGGSWYGYTAGCRSYVRRIPQEGLTLIAPVLLEIESERHRVALEWINRLNDENI